MTARQLTLAATILGSSLAFIDTTVVIVALPTIERELDLGLAGQQWIFLAYSLILAALYLTGGAVGDRYGRRQTFAAGVVAFALASALAGAAPGGALLIAARALQGVGGAFLTTNSLALLRATYGDEAGKAIGLWTAFTSVSTLAGPLVGGALVEWVSWRWIFFLNLPLAAATLLLAYAGRTREHPTPRVGRLDLPGAVLAAAGFGSLTYALVEERWWALGIAAPLLTLFVLVELRSATPMLPLTLFRRHNFTVVNAQTFVVYGSLYGFFVYFTIYVQFLGLSPFEAGLLNIPSSAALIFLAARFGALSDRYGPRLFLSAAPLVMAAGTLVFMLVDEQDEVWTIGVAGIVVFALGLAMLVAPITATALKAVPKEYAGIASGVNSTVSRLGSLITVAMIGFVVTTVFGHEDAVPLAKNQVDSPLGPDSVDAFRAGMLVSVGLAVVGAALGLAVSNREARGEVETAAPEPALGTE
ncbi:MAG TPA: MFS transporter [Gaiellaceae bacterium]|jgi:EmrB/QacA subfamily drug resistance transporter|nr:MFS transporter [Gaiellaceae bacterium]